MILSDRDLRALLASGRLVIEPLDEDAVQPSSIDLRVGSQFRVFANSRRPYIDVRQPMDDLTELVEASEEEPFILHPGEFVLGSTLESVTLPDDMVGRLEGKSSMGRLGLLIHSSLPGDETVPFVHGGELRPTPIGEIVGKRLEGAVVAFDPETFAVGYHQVTGWYEGPPDRVFEVVLASGRRVRVTGGHNLFTLDRDGRLRRIRTHELVPGSRVAVPLAVPDPASTATSIDLIALAPESSYPDLLVQGPAVTDAFRENGPTVRALLRVTGHHHTGFYQDRAQLPIALALALPGLVAGLGGQDRVRVRGSRQLGLPVRLEVDEGVAWLLGLYVAEGSRRHGQAVWSNTDQGILDRAQGVIESLGLRVYRSAGAVVCCSVLLSRLLEWLGTGPRALEKRIPSVVFGWPRHLLESFFEGFVDGDGSRERTRVSLWTASEKLAGDWLFTAARLGRRASASSRLRASGRAWQISLPLAEHKMLTAVPLADRLLVRLRDQAGLRQDRASRLAGYRHPTDLANIERRVGRDAVRRATLRRLREVYRARAPADLPLLDRLVDGQVAWDTVVEVRETGSVEPVYDLEVRPDGRRIENFLAGYGGIFVSNTAGFVDAGFSGHLTLELSNVANLPITIYPGMRIGQLALFTMSSPAERPYGSEGLRSKYQGQQGPTPSRYFENFD